MKVLGWIFFILLIFGAGFLACQFGWFDNVLSIIVK